MTLIARLFLSSALLFGVSFIAFAQEPEISKPNKVTDENYLPDFSFAGYKNGLAQLSKVEGKEILATDFGVIADDGLDDSKALLKAMTQANMAEGPVILQLPAGRIILSEILYVERSNFILRGAGSGLRGTEIYCPRPMMYLKDPESLAELREYLEINDKYQRETENNIDLPFSQYAWTGGMIWTRVPGERVKYYLEKYDVPINTLAKVMEGKRGERTLKVENAKALNVGDIVQLELFNKEGESARIIEQLYKNTDVKVGSHHWNFPELPLIAQQVEIKSIKGNLVTLEQPLLVDIGDEHHAKLTQWKHLENVGIEHLRIAFPDFKRIAHHVEPGYNGIYLTRLYDSWVRDVTIDNADSGILTEEIANVTIKDIVTSGNNYAHYTVQIGGVHNVLVEGLKVYNKAEHPLSFNTFSTKSVYKNCEVFVDPVLDQHSGANHQNLFDNITVHLDPSVDGSYPLFAGGGAGYWKPSHGAFTTFWNIDVHFLSGLDRVESILLDGMSDGPYARLIGVHGNHPVKIGYGPKPYISLTNQFLETVPSLYEYQLKKRKEGKEWRRF